YSWFLFAVAFAQALCGMCPHFGKVCAMTCNMRYCLSPPLPKCTHAERVASAGLRPFLLYFPFSPFRSLPLSFVLSPSLVRSLSLSLSRFFRPLSSAPNCDIDSQYNRRLAP